MTLFDRLAAHWKIERLPPEAHETASAIDRFENRFGLTLPTDVREFYERFNWLFDATPDEDLNSFWPIEELDTVPNKIEPFAGIPDFTGIAANLPDATNYYAFADHSIWVMVYAVRLTDDPSTSGPVICIGDGSTFDKLTNTFSEFWELYLETPERILVP